MELIGTGPRVHARIAGGMGLLVLASGTFAGLVVSRLIVGDDAVATSNNVAASELLFRFGIAGNLVMMVAWLFYALLLYRLLRPVGKNLAMSMLALVMVAVPIYMLNQINLSGVLLSASGGLHERVELFLALQRFGGLVSAIFFGLWLIPLGLLVYQSGFLPRLLGVLLIVGSPGYLLLFVQGFFLPGTERTLWTNPFLAITHLAELALLLWLLIRGVNVGRWEQSVRGAAPQ